VATNHRKLTVCFTFGGSNHSERASEKPFILTCLESSTRLCEAPTRPGSFSNCICGGFAACGIRSVRAIGCAPILVCFVSTEEENDMRIICDHCSRQISGTVKRLAGNFNLHPDCLDRSAKELKHESNTAQWTSQEASFGTLVEWKRNTLCV
jgi:hypothetical protein